jgi:hypothetical protein
LYTNGIVGGLVGTFLATAAVRAGQLPVTSYGLKEGHATKLLLEELVLEELLLEELLLVAVPELLLLDVPLLELEPLVEPDPVEEPADPPSGEPEEEEPPPAPPDEEPVEVPPSPAAPWSLTVLPPHAAIATRVRPETKRARLSGRRLGPAPSPVRCLPASALPTQTPVSRRSVDTGTLRRQ